MILSLESTSGKTIEEHERIKQEINNLKNKKHSLLSNSKSELSVPITTMKIKGYEGHKKNKNQCTQKQQLLQQQQLPEKGTSMNSCSSITSIKNNLNINHNFQNIQNHSPIQTSTVTFSNTLHQPVRHVPHPSLPPTQPKTKNNLNNTNVNTNKSNCYSAWPPQELEYPQEHSLPGISSLTRRIDIQHYSIPEVRLSEFFEPSVPLINSFTQAFLPHNHFNSHSPPLRLNLEPQANVMIQPSPTYAYTTRPSSFAPKTENSDSRVSTRRGSIEWILNHED